MFDPKNPMVSATMRHMRWEIAKSFPNAHYGAFEASDPGREAYIKEWVNTYLIEKGNWISSEPRESMVNHIMEDMFGPLYGL